MLSATPSPKRISLVSWMVSMWSFAFGMLMLKTSVVAGPVIFKTLVSVVPERTMDAMPVVPGDHRWLKQLDEELLRRASPEAAVPLDRDPVPDKFGEAVKRYYERLGSGQ